MGGVGNGAAEEDWRWDLNPGMAAMPSWDHVALLPCGLGSRRDFAWKKRGERIFAGGP